MNTTKLIIICCIVLVFVIILYIVISNSLTSTSNVSSINSRLVVSPTGVLIRNPINQSLYVANTNPLNNATNVPLDSPIVLTFNRLFASNEITITILPQTSFSTTISSNQLQIKPTLSLSPGSQYTLILKFKDLHNFPQDFTFTTIGPTTSKLPNTGPKGAAQEFDADQRQNFPDVFLSNHTPYATSDFSISYSLKYQPKEHYAFLVILKDADQNLAKSKFTDWLHSLQLTDQQIKGLDITYQ